MEKISIYQREQKVGGVTTRNATNTLLHKAKKSKNDEFYTQLLDIESELKHYEGHFKNKIVYCNCDDWETSNFVKYFQENFKRLGIRKLISTCYIENGTGKFFEYNGIDINTKLLEGDGDYISQECIGFLQQADIVVTNPPFSLFREYIGQLVKYSKTFLAIANINAITYKEIFKLIKKNKIWLGINLGRGVSGFIVPAHYELYGAEARIDENGNRIVSPNNCLWLTNMDNLKRHEYLDLTKSYIGGEVEYLQYDNYDGINVNKTKDIPYDYQGAMGVPITFLHKYNPDQFEIIKFRKGNDEKDLSIHGKCPYFRILIRNKRYNCEQFESPKNIQNVASNSATLSRL